ncbi:MAG: hypothetical protein KatS3mg121_0033 [Gammaproteobacteria bacterium]|nr:MAG: hypothetical protein KatS3mg121_0033 [Gammaproteobacteria bacterium]
MSTPVDIDALRGLVPIGELSPEALRELARKTPEQRVAAGRFLFKQGERDGRHVYLLEGAVDLLDDKTPVKRIRAGDPEARHPLAHQQPRRYGARAVEDCRFVAIDSDLLDIMMTWNQTGTYQVRELAADEPAAAEDWMTRLLNTPAFHKVPPANLQTLFQRMEAVPCKAGDVIVRQGEEGEHFYIIQSGRALVTRATPAHPKGIKLAELGPGDGFGEEALIAGGKRNATITMLSRGTLMRLSKADFLELLNKPLEREMDYAGAAAAVAAGRARWLDVRLPAEYKHRHIDGALNVPLVTLRLKLKTLDPNTLYVAYCDTGRRASVAAFILGEHGFEAAVLRGGLAAAPEAALRAEA